MKIFFLHLVALAAIPFAAAAAEKNCGCGCCRGKEVCCCNVATAAAEKAAEQSHPLRGVVVTIDRERAELTVKHEAIPGVMRAMTMIFRVEPAALAHLSTGQTITARMSRRDGEWWLHEIKSAAPSRSGS